MQYEIDFNNLSLYLLKRVIVTFADGRCAGGILTNVSPTAQEIMLDNVAYSINDISDIEMTGNITYHTYSKDSKKSCDIDGLYFGLDDFVPDTDSSKILYGEFNCIAACHLVFAESKLSARDVRILSCSHKIYLPALAKSSHMYLLHDGSILVGTMEDSEVLSIHTATGSAISINLDDVQDIIRLPLTNEFVEIALRTGNVLSGVVSAANDSMIVVINETVQAVQLVDVLSLRYKGIITAGTVKLTSGTVKQIKISLGVKEETFLCKLPYFRSSGDESIALDGVSASFVPGVTDRGLIAKDVVVESKIEVTPETEYETGIVVIAPTLNRTIGYIGKEFVTKTYSLITRASMPRGSVSFSADQLSFRINPRNVYVVRYQCARDENPLKAQDIELKEFYPMSDYAKIWIDEFGIVQKLPVSVLFLDKFLNQVVDIEANDGLRLSGTLTRIDATELTLSDKIGKHQIKTENILRVFYYGTVTAYQPNNGTGFINGQYWFHVNNFSDMNQILRLEVGSPVRFTFEVSTKGNMCAAKCIELTEGFERKGYVLKYISKYPGKGFGFIVTPDLLEEHLRKNDKSGTIYFREADIENPETFKIDTNKYYYLVTYTEGENNTAHNVRFLEEHSFKAKSEPKQVVIPASKHTEVKNISDLVEPTVSLAGTEYEYGLINIFSSHYALINPQYFNRTYAPDGVYDISKSVYFNPEETRVTPDPRLKTGKYAYLVRYVKKGVIKNPTTGMEQPTIDYSYPVEVVYTFPKKQCASILLDDGKITIEYVDDVAPELANVPKASEENDDAPDVMLGESIYFKLKDGSVCHGVYSGENTEAYILSNGTSISKNVVSRLFRFGVITALSAETGTATINNLFDFSLNVAEPKMVSILKNQKHLVRLHVMYSCDAGKITEVCRVSKRCLSCLMWDAGIVTGLDNQAHNITIDSSITHYLTVMSDGVNTYVNNDSILNRAVYVKQVFHPYLGSDSLDADIVAMAVDVRCQEEELKIQYDDGKDVYLGYRNATISFPILGASKDLHEKIGETIIVTFRVGADMSTLEGYVDEDYVEAEDSAESADEHNLAKIQQEALCLLLLQREDTEQLVTGKIYLDEEGKLTDPSQVQRAVDFLISKSKHLAAIKVALKYPEFDVLANMDNLLRAEIQTRCTAVGLDANSYYGEQAFYLSTVLQYPTHSRTRGRSSNAKFSNYDYLYRLFSQEFESREHLVKYLQAGRPANKATLASLFRKPCLQLGELIAHIVLLDKVNLDIVCSLIRGNSQLSDEIITYAKDIDDMISDQDIAAVIRSIQDRYLRDKRRFSERIVAMIGQENICDNLKKLIGNMQSRFLRLICRDDCLRFERLLKICTDVLDYINKPGFTHQEQLLQHAYREVGILEEDILTHPCKESTEILLSSGQFDLTSNILVSLKNEIHSLLNRLYQDASKPQIHCRVNETSILPGAKKFWLIVENGSQNENFQPAENLSIELEPFTLGFMPQAKVNLPQNKLACGDQLAVEVEFELSGDVASVLEFGWTARYQYTTKFHSNGNTTRSVCRQESDAPLQLQLDNTMVEQKDYSVDNPYFAPARGQPLIGKEMFFGRENERKKILESICLDDSGKCFIPGSAVIIHGQKKSGKTSLVNQIKNYIKEEPVLADKAILLNFSNILTDTGGVQQLDCFQRTFYTAIMSRLKHEIKRCHPDVVQLLKENDITIPNLLRPDYRDTWPVAFDAFFQEFYSIDQGRHNIILFMDEFTLLCTTILAEVQRFPEKASLNNIPNFIKTFSQYGFIQIIIGHEAMMRALGTLGVLNHTAEFAKSIEISALDDVASRALVTQPMMDKFGYDVYGTELGKQAVDRLLDLSGRNPAYLMRLCNKMFMYYIDKEKCPRTQLLLSDVNAMVQEYTGELLLSDFDILLMEDGDDAVDAEKRITYHYLKNAALLSLASYDKRTADSSEITRGLARDFGYAIAEIEKTRNILEARRVISITNGGRVKINTGLFAEYIQQKNGLS